MDTRRVMERYHMRTPSQRHLQSSGSMARPSKVQDMLGFTVVAAPGAGVLSNVTWVHLRDLVQVAGS